MQNNCEWRGMFAGTNNWLHFCAPHKEYCFRKPDGLFDGPPTILKVVSLAAFPLQEMGASAAR